MTDEQKDDLIQYRLDNLEGRMKDMEKVVTDQRLLVARWSGIVIVINAIITLIGVPLVLAYLK